jgi:hypothetical protein
MALPFTFTAAVINTVTKYYSLLKKAMSASFSILTHSYYIAHSPFFNCHITSEVAAAGIS